jgi:uncharacterized membrane protein
MFHKPWIPILSLILNAALAGFVFGQYLRNEPPPFPMRFSQPFDRSGSSLESDEMFDAVFRPEQPKMMESMKEMVEAQHRVQELLRAEKIDLVAFESALENMKVAGAQSFDSLQRALLNAAKLEPAQRRKLADTLERMPPPGPRGGRMGIGP